MSEPADRTRTMRLLLLALIPGIAAQTAFFGAGTLANLGLCVAACLASEAACLQARKQAPGPLLRDGSALLTGLLLGLALPTQGPWWLPLLGGVLAIGVGKQLFGPRGQSPFNPAMVGLALLLVCVPQAMTAWRPAVDGVSSATLLDHVRTELHLARTLGEILGDGHPERWDALWVNLAFLCGGLALLGLKQLPWRIPLAVLAGLALPAFTLWSLDTSLHPSPVVHLLSGGTMLAAFFVATAPPSSPRAAAAQWLYGLGIGLGAYAIRSWGDYPDGFAFAVLLLNATAPALDRQAGESRAFPVWSSRLLVSATLLAIASAVAVQVWQRHRDEAVPPLAALGFERAGISAIEALQDPALGDFRLYRVRRDGEAAGILVRSLATGYAGDIDILTALRADGTISAVQVLQHRETRGIGDRIVSWVGGFDGTTAAADALSGATVSAHAVQQEVARSLDYFHAQRSDLPRNAAESTAP